MEDPRYSPLFSSFQSPLFFLPRNMSSFSAVLPILLSSVHQASLFRLSSSTTNHNTVSKILLTLFHSKSLRDIAAHIEEQDRNQLKNPRCVSRYVCLRDGDELVGCALWGFFLTAAEKEKMVEMGWYASWPGEEGNVIAVTEEEVKQRRKKAMGDVGFACT